MSRGGHIKERDEPERRCIVTGEVQPKAGLIRFVAGPDGQVVPDLAEKLPGRGIWVTADRAAIAKAAAKGLFSRGARARVGAPDGPGWTNEPERPVRKPSISEPPDCSTAGRRDVSI